MLFRSVDVKLDGAFGYALRVKDANKSATRKISLQNANYAFLSFCYRKTKTTQVFGRDVIIQASSDGVTFGTVYTIAGNGTADAAYVNIYNQDISQYCTGANTFIRVLTNGNMSDADSVYIDNISVSYIKYPQCYITSFNSSLIPTTYHMTTPDYHTMTATSGITCLSPYDFGVSKNSISISGTIYNDANGLVDGQVNGTAMGMPDNNLLYAYLVDSTGRVEFISSVDPVLGTYSFPLADV